MAEELAMDHFHYQDIGFDGVYLLNGIEVTPFHSGEEVSIQNITSLHSAVFKALCTCNVKLTGNMIRAMRTELDLSQPHLGRLLGWSDRQSLALCEAGKKRMPFAQQYILKSHVLSHIDGNTSIHCFTELVVAEAPDHFEFRFTGSGWEWANTVHREPEIHSIPQPRRRFGWSESVGMGEAADVVIG